MFLQLVSQLYDPANTGNPAKIKVIQEQLQGFQKGPQAWLVANSLLNEDHTDLKFFGALTFTVKINPDWCVPLPFRSRGQLTAAGNN